MLIGIDGNEANTTSRVGSNQYAFEVIRALWGLRSDNQFVIYLRERPLGDLPPEGGNWQYRIFGPKKLWTQWRLPIELFLGKIRPNIFFSPGHYAPRWSPIPLVVSIMDLGFLKFPEQFTKKDLYQLTLWTARSIKKAKHILTISENTKNDIIKKYNIPASRITVTYLGYDREKFKIHPDFIGTKVKIEEIKKRYGVEGRYILFLGTLKPSKNIGGLLQAYSIWLRRGKKHDQLRLVIAGKKGWLYEEIFKKAEELGLGNRVVFTDFVPDDDIPALMAGAEVFVMPSFWEGFGIPILEAMASGVPVVTSNVASLSEVVGKAGILVNPYDLKSIAEGIERALQERTILREKGLSQVKEFSWEKCAQQTLAVLEKFK